MSDGSDGKRDDGEQAWNTIQQSSKSDESAEAMEMKRRQIGPQDGLIVSDPHSYLKREDLVQNAIKQARQSGLLVVCSPPGSGKTSLMQLMIRSLHQNNNNNNIHAQIVRPSQPCKPDFDLFDYVRNRTGVCFEHKTLSAGLQSYSEVWLLFDDAQKLCGGQMFQDFWEVVVKTRNSMEFVGTRVIVVVAATDYLANEADSPVALRSEPRIQVENLLLTEDEARRLFNIRFVRPSWCTHESALFRLTKGNVAAFVIGMDLIARKILSEDNKSMESLDEEAAIKELYEGIAFLELLERCFPVKTVNPNSRSDVLDAIVEAYKVDGGEGFTSSPFRGDPVNRLKKAGILSKRNRFTSPAAASFYYSFLYPRASLSTEPPESLAELVTMATSRLSARRLRVARQKNKAGILQTPKKAVFQQLFHESIATLLPPSYRIVPEYGTEALVNGEFKHGELDFYIKNGAKWGLELLRDGDRIGEHLGRITEKYQNVKADEWLVVDCRMTGGHPALAPDRCSLVFEENFRSCQCFMRMSPQPTTVQLME